MEVRIATGVVALGALVFVAVALARGADTLKLPVGAAILAAAVCVGLVVRLRFVRVIAIGAVFVLAVVHLLIAMSDGPWWVRLVSGVLTAGYVYCAVLLNTLPARQYLEPK
ncbi:hypothetical protein [Actinocrispum wychmicini]|nr:hypothetical protein [Actinocrispum wychmicini]